MTVNYKSEPIHLMIVEDDPHELEEEIQGAAGDGDTDTVMKIFAGLYKEGRTDEIEYILSRHLFNEEQTATALTRIKEEAEAMDIDNN